MSGNHDELTERWKKMKFEEYMNAIYGPDEKAKDSMPLDNDGCPTENAVLRRQWNQNKKEIVRLEECLLDAFMAGADWLEEYRTGHKLTWYQERQKAMGYALDFQQMVLSGRGGGE